LAAVLGFGLLLAACSDDQVGMPAATTDGLEPGGTLALAMADQIETLDPLHARNRAERLAARQIYEPLHSHQQGPFGESRRRPGLARSFHSNGPATIWTAQLRHGVKFSNGEPLDADAVLVNVRRWLDAPAVRELVPTLSAVDSPRPGRVRFLLDRSSPRFPRTLADPRLGMVAPAPLLGLGHGGLRLDAGGTGPFEYRGRGDGGVLLARNAGWWGTPLGLGPGVDQVELTVMPIAARRIDGLLSGAVDVADELGGAAMKRIANDPLLTVVRGPAATLGLERSVRGIDSAAAAQSLADVWLTDLR
jgi:ABC-type transport system substrate-binding protein